MLPPLSRQKTRLVIAVTILNLFMVHTFLFQLYILGVALAQATGYGLGDRGVILRVSVRAEIFSSPSRSYRLCDPSSLLSKKYKGSFPPGVEWSGREADNPPPTSVEVT
jgi:hypothetical protein